MVEQATSLVSVVITTYNRSEILRCAIGSVLAQTSDDFELIIVDDASSDSTAQVVASFEFPRIRYIKQKENQGLPATRNTGLRHAHGKYMAYLDDDDEWLPGKLAKQVELAETKSEDYGVIYCGVQIIGSDGQVLGENRPRLRGDIRAEIGRKGLFTIPSSCLFLRKALEHVGGYDETLTSHVDHGIWMKLAQMGYKADYVDECLVVVRQHRGIRMTTDVETRIRATEMFIEKWHPEWEKWFGVARADDYFSRWYARVLMNQGMNCINKGQLLAGARCHWYIVRRHPGRIRSYAAPAVYFAKVLISRTCFYRPLQHLWRMIRRSRYETAGIA